MAIAKIKYQADPLVDELSYLCQYLQRNILRRQEKDGHWHYALDDNSTINAEYIYFLKWMQIEDQDLIERLAKGILSNQQTDGSWNLYYGGPGNLSATIESYFALRLSGRHPSEPALTKAREFILLHGGIPKCRVFTRIWLALFGLFRWEDIPTIPPEIMLSPRGTPFNIYEFSYWSRTVIIPLTILFHVRRICPIDFNLDELYHSPESKYQIERAPIIPVDESWMLRSRVWDWHWVNWEHVFVTLNRGVSIYESKLPVKPLRKQALEKAKNWILDHQDRSGDWGGIVPAMMNSVMALYAVGMSKREKPVAKGIEALRNLCRGVSSSIRPHAHEQDDIAVLQSCVSPIWDTALGALGLLESGVPATDLRLQRVKSFLWSERITRRSDWAFKSKLPANAEFAAWCFQYHNEFYPDLDDSAVVTLVLHRLGMSRAELQPAIQWMLGMQNSDGGWGTFDRDNNQWVLNEIPFADLKSLLDPSNPDVTGHVLETLGDLGFAGSKVTQRALRYLKAVQRPDGSWFGRWGVNTLYGTCAAVVGMRAVGEPADSSSLKRALRFILNNQNDDGGWGESCDSYSLFGANQKAPSTPSQTAWALMTIHACDANQEEVRECIRRGIRFLESRKSDDGLFEKEFTGTGFPMHFYLRYDGYRNYFPLIALGRLKKVFSKSSAEVDAEPNLLNLRRAQRAIGSQRTL